MDSLTDQQVADLISHLSIIIVLILQLLRKRRF